MLNPKAPLGPFRGLGPGHQRLPSVLSGPGFGILKLRLRGQQAWTWGPMNFGLGVPSPGLESPSASLSRPSLGLEALTTGLACTISTMVCYESCHICCQAAYKSVGCHSRTCIWDFESTLGLSWAPRRFSLKAPKSAQFILGAGACAL